MSKNIDYMEKCDGCCGHASCDTGVNDPASVISSITAPVGDASSDITQICCLDTDLGLFENQYPVPDGMTYNSYFIDDEHPTVLDTADDRATSVWLETVGSLLAGRKPAMLIVQHLEPDHAGSTGAFLAEYPDCRVVCTAKAADMLPQFLPDVRPHVQVVGEGDTVSTGRHTLRFITAPMVHWPEVMVTYDCEKEVLFSADAFGTFGCSLARELMVPGADRTGALERWIPEAARYYFNICGKYGSPVQKLIMKAGALPVKDICPLHGPVIEREIHKAESIYDSWSRGVPDFPKGVFIAVATLHGNTFEAAVHLQSCLEQAGITDVKLADLSRADMSQCVSDAFRYGTTVFASATYDASVVPAMADFIEHLSVKNWHGRRVAVMENGSWAPVAARIIQSRLSAMKDLSAVQPVVTVRSRMNNDSRAAIEALAKEIGSAME